MGKKPVRPLGMVRSNAPVPFLSPYTERLARENENRKLVTALQHAKPAIDNVSPMQHPHLQDNRKREWLSDSKKCLSARYQILRCLTAAVWHRPDPNMTSLMLVPAVKYAKIERENALLLERLCLIARPRSQYVKPKTFT